MAFACAPTEVAFVDTAPYRFAETFHIDQPAAEVWGQLTGDNALHWCRAITRLTWTSPRPFAVGTTRSVRVLGMIGLDERYDVWEEGRRKAFVGLQCNLPLLSRVAEEYIVEPVTDSSSTFNWKIGVEPSGAGKPGMPLNKQIFASLFKDTRKYFAAMT